MNRLPPENLTSALVVGQPDGVELVAAFFVGHFSVARGGCFDNLTSPLGNMTTFISERRKSPGSNKMDQAQACVEIGQMSNVGKSLGMEKGSAPSGRERIPTLIINVTEENAAGHVSRRQALTGTNAEEGRHLHGAGQQNRQIKGKIGIAIQPMGCAC